MSKSSVKVTSNFNSNELPVTISCPNDECKGKVTFKIGDVEAKKSAKCQSCGVVINLKPS